MATLLPTLGAVAVAVLTAVFGIVNYRNQKRIDRQVELRNRRMKGYEDYLTSYRDYVRLEGTDEEVNARTEYWSAYSSLFQIASDPVLLAATEFHSLAWKNPDALEGANWYHAFRKLYADMLVEMRKDAFEKTELPRIVVEQRIPFDLE